ncbi:MAG TPA: SMI1/KNR4 family protein [Trichocoleus sp.]
MQTIWARIDAWLMANAPGVLKTLQPGASDAQIEAFEKVLGVQLPEDVKASFRIHNGQSDHEYGLMDGRELLSLDRIQDEWLVWKDLLDSHMFEDIEGDPEPGIRSDWWNAAWIPLTHDGGGNHDCLDLAPAQGGTVGQIISMWHDEAERERLAPSFRAWLTQLANGLESGQYIFSEEYGGIVNSEDI